MISGHAEAVKRAVEIASQLGAKRAVILPVSAPFHCALMMPAQEKLEKDLRKTEFAALRFPLVTNVDADTETSGDEARDASDPSGDHARAVGRIGARIDRRGREHVRRSRSEPRLTGLLRQIERSVGTLNVEDEKSLATTVEKIAQSREDAA